MIRLLLLEKRTLLKGWIVVFVSSFPFTFLPAIFKEGEFLQRMIDRAPWSLLYAAGFAFVVCGAALYQNYERQRIKLKLFNKPAFRNLGFHYFQAGKGSLVNDLGFYLAGSHSGFDFSIDMQIDLEDHSKQEIVITPVREIETGRPMNREVKEYKQVLRRDFRYSGKPHQLEILLKPEELNAEDPKGMSKYLALITSKLKMTLV